MLKIDDNLLNPYVDITESCGVDNEPPAKKEKCSKLSKSSWERNSHMLKLLKEKHPNISRLHTKLYKRIILEIEDSV